MIGLETAPLTTDDIADATRVWRACEAHDIGEALLTWEDLTGIVKRPSCDLERHSVGVRDGGALVAVGLLLDEPQSLVRVLPEQRGRGIGSWLLRWSEDAGRAAGHVRSSQTIPESDLAGAELLRAAGFAPRWEAWMFEIELCRAPDPPRLAPGYSVRALMPGGGGERAAHRVIDEAFGEWPERDPWPYDDWAAQTVERPGFRPENVVLVEHGDDVVGAAVLVHEESQTWVDQLAVARTHRGRGLARALLMHAFGTAWERGVRRCGLGTDSRTGARTLYEHVGMRVKHRFVEYAKEL